MGCGVSGATASPPASFNTGGEGDPKAKKKEGGETEELLEALRKLLQANPELISGGGTSNPPI